MSHPLPDREAIIARLRAAETEPLSDARRRAAQLLRRLTAITVDGDTDAATLDAMAARLDEVVAALGDRRPLSRYAGAGGRPEAVYLTAETHPVGGRGNPVAVPFDVETDGDVVRTRVRFGPAHEGTPGVVHGGMVAATFDHLLGAAAIRTGHPIVTGTLTVRYRRPSPLDVDLLFEGRAVGTEGRKITVQGTAQAAGEVTAEAEALFLAVDIARYVPPAP